MQCCEHGKIKLFYWGLKARAQVPSLIAEVGGIHYEWVQNPDWPGMKAQTPFGQLPYLEDGHVKMGQSMAIARYMARKAGLQGDTDSDFAMSEQLIEEQNDLYVVLAKAQYATGDKTEAWKNALEVEVPKHLANLENLLHGDYFCSKMLAGELAIFAILNIILDIDPHTLDKTHKLKAFYDRVAAHPKVAAWLRLGIPQYFKTKE